MKFFPADSPLPEQRTDYVLLPDPRLRSILQQRIAEGATAIIYVEGTIQVDDSCFGDPEMMCLPYRHPIDIRATSFRVVDPNASQQFGSGRGR